MRFVWLSAFALVVSLAACFESGPLASRAGSLNDDTTESADDGVTTTTPDTTPPDTTPTVVFDSTPTTSLTDAPLDVAPDIGPDIGPDAAVTETVVDTVTPVDARSCLIDSDCTGVAQLDKCAGEVACVDYKCQQDPSTAVHCQRPVGGDACIDLQCNPTTGQCEEVELCSCAPALTLPCNGRLDFTTSEPPAIEHFSSYSCGPSAGPWVDQIVGFSPSAGRVRLDLQSAGTTGMHVLELDGDRCDAASGCVTGGVSRLYFDASARPYVVVLDYVAANAMVALQATCGITTETECNDGLDDDGDNVIDCDEPECNGQDGCPLILDNETGHCNDGRDDDDDQRIDCDDDDCWHDSACLETCQYFTSPVVGCGFHQGSTTGGGTARAQHYACSPTPAPGKETVYRFRPSFSGIVDFGFTSVPGVALYLLKDTGAGCTPRDCLTWGANGFSWPVVEDTTYYLAIDTAAGVTGNYDLHVTCD